MTTISKTPLRPVRNRLQATQLFLRLEKALGDPSANKHEFFATVERLADVLQRTPASAGKDATGQESV